MQGREPFALSTFGSFTVAGRRAEVTGLPLRHVQLSRDLPAYPVDPNGTYAVDHAYVQYFVPEPVGHPPLVFVHGGGMAGTTWEGTPDGREGWLQYFLRRGHPCYVVDNVERGRAGWLPDPAGPTDGALLRTEQEAWDAFRIGPPEGYPARACHPGCLFPVEALEALARQQVPRWMTTTALAVGAVTALVERIGRCRVVAHSQGGGIAVAAAAATPALVESLVLVEPHGLPDDGGPAGVRQLLVSGDFLDRTPLYRRLRAQWSAYVGGAAGPVGHLDLPAAGRAGNSHMPMMDTNSDVVATMIAEWLGASVPA
ncbi:alpha/beta fold hydrolase [Pseudonocardia sp. ICBG162]|uniref:alpha/beta fold hydrolase n=1 Tax=Pseudonocardia sp. ICBG162 TaxID=2846761 RepID=UPI001CF638CA|nr:alpha/beta fold hydrolase [Pseudonocardia sp. ICBG162]